MKNLREIKMVLTRKPPIEGTGVHLHPVFGFRKSPQLNPFLMLDDFRSDNPEHYTKKDPQGAM